MRRIVCLTLLRVVSGGSLCAFGTGIQAFELQQAPLPKSDQSLEAGVWVEEGEDRVSWSWSNPSELVDVIVDLSFAADDDQPKMSVKPSFGNDEALPSQFRSLKWIIEYSDLVNLNFSQTVDDRFDHNETYMGFDAANDLSDDDPDRLITTDVTLGFLDERVRVKRRVKILSFDEARFDVENSANANWENAPALLESSGETGTAVLERVDATLWRSDSLKVSVFGLRNTVDESYQTFEDYEKKIKQNDPLEVANRVTYKYGVEAGLGPLAINFAEFTYEPLDAGDESPSREQGYEAGISFDVSDLRGRVKRDLGETIWKIAPTSIWVKFSEASVDLETAAFDDAKSDVGVGGKWGWGSLHGGASYWHSVYDSRQTGTDEADWNGDGMDVSVGYSRDHWGVDTTLSLGRYQNDGAWQQSLEGSHDATVSAWIDLEELPGIKGALSLGRYATNDLLYDGDNVSDYLNFDLSLDFAKYLAEREGLSKRSLKLYYGLDHSLDRTQATAAQESLTDHTVFLRYSTGL